MKSFRNRESSSWDVLIAAVVALMLVLFSVLWTFHHQANADRALQPIAAIDTLADRIGIPLQFHISLIALDVACVLLAIAVIYTILRLRKEAMERKRGDENLKVAAYVFDKSFNAIIIADAQNRVVAVNAAYTRMLGYAKEEVVGKKLGYFLTEHSKAVLEHALRTEVDNRTGVQLEVQSYRKDGEILYGLASGSYIRDSHDNRQYLVGVLADISAQKKYEAQLERMAHYDRLTGLPNRILMTQLVEQAMAKNHCGENSIAICYLDLDDFQTINDDYSQEVGDQVLGVIAERLRTILRSGEVAAHLGGDEFVLLMLAELPSADYCYARLDEVLASVRAPITVASFSLTLSTSIGVTFYPHDLSSADSLVRHANQAMHQAKQNGKNRVHLFNTDHERNAQQRRDMLLRVREAHDKNQFVLYYQPKVDLIDKRVVGAEALIRWLHPEQGLIPPGEFLPCLEGSDFEITLGEWVIETALQQIDAWLHGDGMCIPVSVNISAKHLLQPDFSERLRVALARHPDVLEHSLELEIVETAALDDLDAAIRTLTECKKLGVRFALDDFGTGYSSLSYFQRLPVDILKIDQSFVRNMHENRADLEIIESVVKLAQVFNRAVIAEGIETDEHAALLCRIGCRLGQGYGIAKPMPALQLRDWIRQWENQLHIRRQQLRY